MASRIRITLEKHGFSLPVGTQKRSTCSRPAYIDRAHTHLSQLRFKVVACDSHFGNRALRQEPLHAQVPESVHAARRAHDEHAFHAFRVILLPYLASTVHARLGIHVYFKVTTVYPSFPIVSLSRARALQNICTLKKSNSTLMTSRMNRECFTCAKPTPEASETTLALM